MGARLDIIKKSHNLHKHTFHICNIPRTEGCINTHTQVKCNHLTPTMGNKQAIAIRIVGNPQYERKRNVYGAEFM